MKKLTIMLGVALCAVFVMSSCRSSRESAYRKAYEKAKQQELAQPATTQAEQQAQEAPVADVPVVVKKKAMMLRQLVKNVQQCKVMAS